MRTLLLTFLILCISSISFGQLPAGSSGGVISGSNANVLNQLQLLDIRSSNNDVLTYEQIEGSPYIDNNSGAANNLPIGKFYTSDFTYITTALARYNAYTDNMEVSPLEDGVDYYLLKKKPDFLYIVLRKKMYRAYSFEGTMSFFVILSETDDNACTLLKKEKVEFKKAERPKSSFITAEPDSFKRLRDLYYFKLNDHILEIPKKKKHFFAIFNEQGEAIQNYVSEHQLKLNNERDLLLISNYYNTLTH